MSALARMREENNVVGLKSSFYSAFNNYMITMEGNSKATYKNYMSHFKQFFEFVWDDGKDSKRNISISDITWDMVLDIVFEDIQMYQQYLVRDKKNKSGTVNQKVSELRGLWEYLYNYNQNIKVEIFNVLPLKVTSKGKGASALSEDEMLLLIEFAGSRGFKPEIQKAFFRFSAITGLRKSAMLGVTWDKVKRVSDFKSNEMYWVVEDVWDKSVERTIPIEDRMYEELCEIRDDSGSDNRLFCICEDILDRTMKEFKVEYGLDKKISFHSLRKTSADLAYNMCGGDLRRVMQQTAHKDPKIILERYAGTNSSLGDHPGLMMFQELDVEGKLSGLGKDELIEIIMECSKSTQREILGKVK